MGIIWNKDPKADDITRMLLCSIALERKMNMFQDSVLKSRNNINPDFLKNEIDNISLLYSELIDSCNEYLKELR